MVRALCKCSLRAGKELRLCADVGSEWISNGLVGFYGHVLSLRNGHVLRLALDLEVERQSWNGRVR